MFFERKRVDDLVGRHGANHPNTKRQKIITEIEMIRKLQLFRSFSTYQFRGVTKHENEMKKWRAVLSYKGKEIDGGFHWTEEDAAKAYDELVLIYRGKNNAKDTLNFPNQNTYSNQAVTKTEWQSPEKRQNSPLQLIPVRKGKSLSLDEILHALDEEKAIDVRTIDLSGKSTLAEHMVFCTGTSRLHMRNMADLLVDAIRAREIQDDFEYGVEGRDCEDWMIVDAKTIIVHFLREDTRRVLNLESHWENMKDNMNTEYGHLSAEEYVEKYGAAEGVQDAVVEDEEEKDWV